MTLVRKPVRAATSQNVGMRRSLPEVIAGFVAEAERAPGELSTIANVMPAPPLPFVPEELHGSLVVAIISSFALPGGNAP